MSNLSFKYFNVTSLLTFIIGAGTLINYFVRWLLSFLKQHNIECIQFPTTGALTIIILTIINKYLYQFPLLWNIFMNVPYIGGNYIGKMSYSFKNSDNEEINEEKICEMKVRQNCSNIHFDCKFYFENINNKEITESKSYAEHIEIIRLKYLIHFPYTQSGSFIGHDVPQASGFNTLEYDADKKSIEGNYFSNRPGSQGGIIQVNKIN